MSKEKMIAQKELGEVSGVHVAQIRRYENSTSQPTLDVIRKIAIALYLSSYKLRDEALSKLMPDEKKTVKELVEGILLKHEAKRWHRGSLAE